MKDSTLTIRLPSAMRRRVEALAETEGRSLSAQVERLIEAGLSAGPMTGETQPTWGARSLEGVLEGAGVTTLADWRKVREELSASLLRRVERDDDLRR